MHDRISVRGSTFMLNSGVAKQLLTSLSVLAKAFCVFGGGERL
jgi:hypothetical protein